MDLETILTTNLTVSFKMTRLVDKRIQSCHITLALELEIDPELSSTLQLKNLNNMRYWIDNILSESIAFNVNSTLNTELFGDVDNHLMFCPDEPHDHLLLVLIAAKLNAIGDTAVTVKSATIDNDVSHGFGNTLLGDPSILLVSDEDWMGKIRFYDKAWWNRSDGSMMDIPVNEGDNPANKPDILLDFDKPAVQIITDDSDSDTNIGAEIIRLNFKPNNTNDTTKE